MTGSILVVDDDACFGRSLGHALAEDGYRVEVFDRAPSALAELEREAYDLVVTDLVMPGIDGLELMEQAKRIRPECEVVLITGHPTIGTVQAALRRGARDYLTKPASFDDEVRPLVRSVMGRRRGSRAVTPGPAASGLAEAEACFEGVAGEGPMKSLLGLLPRIARADAPVLVQGESGTGKELVARAIHRLSQRSHGPFVAVNCAALPDGLLESELFGVARGAYTGAHRARPGFFEAARRGTLLLDEVAEMSPMLQAKLLRVIQEGAYYRLGDPSQRFQADARIIAATHRDLEAEVEAGRFRLDLFFRLNVVPVSLPPLRDRLGELPRLIDHLVADLGHARPLRVSPEAMEALQRHPWKGNVRELRNALQHALVLGARERLELEHLPGRFRARSPEGTVGAASLPAGTDEDALEPLVDTEARQIRAALQRTQGNRSQAARLLGVSRRVLGYRMRKHGLDREFPLRGVERDAQPWLPGFGTH